MAAPTDVEFIRFLAGVTEADFGDEFIEDLIERAGSEYGAVALLWQIKAADYAKHVSASSGSTSLQMQQRYEHARERAEYYERLAGGLAESEIMEAVGMASAAEEPPTEYSWGEGPWPAEGIWAGWESGGG
jgi:hypothetical protein